MYLGSESKQNAPSSTFGLLIAPVQSLLGVRPAIVTRVCHGFDPTVHSSIMVGYTGTEDHPPALYQTPV